MVIESLSSKTQDYISELFRRNVINNESLKDLTLINYLQNLKVDEDYLHMNFGIRKNFRTNGIRL